MCSGSVKAARLQQEIKPTFLYEETKRRFGQHCMSEKKTHDLYDLQCHVAVFSICRHHHHGELMIIGAIKILI